jgi:hypothetical protein
LDGEFYNTIEQDECDNNKDSQNCKLFTDLTWAGSMYIVIEILAALLLFFWMIRVVVHVRRKVWLHDVVVFVLPLGATGAHGLALVIWMAMARAGFFIECGDWDIRFFFDEVGPVCITQAPKISLAAFLFLFFAACLYLTVYIA